MYISVIFSETKMLKSFLNGLPWITQSEIKSIIEDGFCDFPFSEDWVIFFLFSLIAQKKKKKKKGGGNNLAKAY